MLTCKEFDDFMVDYLDRNLPVWPKYMCWLHVKMCKECAEFLREYQRTIKLGKSAFDAPDAMSCKTSSSRSLSGSINFDCAFCKAVSSSASEKAISSLLLYSG